MAMTNFAGETPLILATKDSNLGRVKQLLNDKVDVNIQDKLGFTALMHAAEIGNIDIVRVLLEAGTDLKIGSKVDRNVYNCASSDFNLLYMDFVPDGTTASMIAYYHHHVEIFKLITEKEKKENDRR